MHHPRLAQLGLVLLLIAAGCSEGGLTELFHPGDALYTISDGAHNGTEGFYFLPPMVRNPDYSGTFDPNLSPVVEICETPACVGPHHATFSKTEGTGSEIVRLDKAAEHYKVNWHTDQTGTEVEQMYRVRVSVAGTVLGHADIQMARDGKVANNTTTNEVIGLVDGRTLPIQFRIEAGAVLVVGSDGGSFVSNDGVVIIEVPEGAVEDDIGVIVTPIADDLNNPAVVPGTVFEFSPSPYSFNQPVILTIVYDPANLPPGSTERLLRIRKLVDERWVAVTGGSVDVTNTRASAPIDGFSSYGVGEEGDSESDACAGVSCPAGYACYGGTCFQVCTEEDAADPEHVCYDRSDTNACAGVVCSTGYACYGGACFQVCTEEDAADPEHVCYDRSEPDACAGVVCSTGYLCCGGACFQGCPDGVDPETGQCISDACAGVNCAEGYFCSGGACFQGCTEEDAADPEHVCYDGSEPDACAGVACPDGYSCYGGTCFLDCTEEDAANPESPCYEGSDPGDPSWHTMGGAQNTVAALLEYGGALIAGGGFTTIGGVSANRIARWDGAQWHPMGSFSHVSALAEYNDDLIAGGNFGVSRWDGTAWQSISTTSNHVALTVHDGELISGGWFTSTGGVSANRVAGWDGSQWRALGSGMNGPVFSLTVYNGELIAGGNFTTADGAPAHYIARWDGAQWHPMSSGMSRLVTSLTVYNGELIAGGRFDTAGGVTAHYIARWDGAQWQRIGGDGMDAYVLSLTVYNGALIAGGEFTTADGVSANHIARWDGSQWHPVGSGMGGGSSPAVRSLIEFASDLVAGGTFITADGKTVDRIARWGTP
jgi:hypothetical protein